MEQKFKDIPKEAPQFGEFYCPWCAIKQRTNLNVHTVYCSGCGRELVHNGKTQKFPDEKELNACSDAQLLWMLRQFCTVSGNTALAQLIIQAVPERPAVAFAAADVLYQNPATRDAGWKYLLYLAENNNYDALVTVYNAYLSDDFKHQAQLKKYSELLVKHYGDLTAGDTLRTILHREKRL